MRLKKPAAVLAAGLLLVAGGGVASAAAEPAKSYGGCVSKSTGYLRILERNNLAASAAGKCKSSERRITLPSVTGVPKLPTKLVFKRPTGTDTCTKDATASTSSTWTFNCVLVLAPTPTPSPTPSS